MTCTPIVTPQQEEAPARIRRAYPPNGSRGIHDVETMFALGVANDKERFAIARVVADRGMISKETIAALEERGLEYILGARERSDPLVR